MLKGKNILIGATGGIAAYKIPFLIRQLIEQQAHIKVILTQAAKAFVTPLTVETVSKNPVYDELFNAMDHIELARWADVFLIVPATANSLAKLAQGLADDLLSTTYLACDKPILIAPAMNRLMWQHATTKRNIKQLQIDGVQIIMPADGVQACGEEGLGRMQEPEKIVEVLQQFFSKGNELAGKKVLITAGPTQEAIDPVRYISNYSSGKMGYALAKEASLRGADVTLISGPCQLDTPIKVKKIAVTSACEMHAAVMENIKNMDIFIANAAVADYRCETPHLSKMPKQQSIELKFIINPDILADVAQLPQHPYVVGFAAETDDIINKGREKLARKKVDMLFVNQVGDSNSGFNSDYNAVTLLIGDYITELPLSFKQELAIQIWDLILQNYARQS